MKYSLRIILLITVCVMGFNTALFSEEEIEKPVWKVAVRQPLYIGSRIFTKRDPQIGYQLYYTYLGYEGDMLKIKYELFYHYDKLVKTETLTLPVRSGGVAMFATKPFYGESEGDVVKVKITVVDAYGRINVEVIK